MYLFYFFLFIGLILVIAEITITTFYLLVIGIVFIFASILSLLIPSGVLVSLIALVLSILGCLWVNYYKNKHKSHSAVMVQHVGHLVEVIEITNNKLRIKYSDSYWDATFIHKNMSALKIGDILTITKYQNNEFFVDFCRDDSRRLKGV